MERRIPSPPAVRAQLGAQLAEAEQALRDAAAAGVVPEDLRGRHAALLEELMSLRKAIEAAFG